MRGMESEIAFQFASDLPTRHKPYSKDEVLGAIDKAFPAIEINETRFVNADELDVMTKLADNILNGALIGQPWSEWPSLVVADQLVEMYFDDKLLYSHKGGNNAVDIFRLIVWIANHMRKKGSGITAGQIITTGSWTGLHQAGKARKIVTKLPQHRRCNGKILAFRCGQDLQQGFNTHNFNSCTKSVKCTFSIIPCIVCDRDLTAQFFLCHKFCCTI